MAKSKNSKIIAAGILFLILFFIIQNMRVWAASDIPSQTREFYVNDFAGILSDDTEQFIIRKSTALADASEAQVVVSTIESLEGDSIEDYANSMFRKYGIGSKEDNNGILILLSVDDRKVRIEVGYGLEGAINDAKAGRVIREVGKPYLSDNNWDEGIKAMYGAVLKEVYTEYGLEEPADVEEMEGITKDKEDDSDILEVIIIVIVLIIIIGNIMNGGGRGRGRRPRYYVRGFYGGGFGGGFGGGGFGGGGASGGGGSSGGGGASGGF